MSTFRPMLVQTRADESAVVRKKKKKVRELQEKNPGLGLIDAQKIVEEKEKADNKARQKKSQEIRKAAVEKARQDLGLTDKSEDKPETKVETKPEVETKFETKVKTKDKFKPKPKSKLKFKRTMSGFKPVREKTSTEKKPLFTKKSKSSTTSKTSKAKETPRVKETSKAKETPKTKTPKVKDDRKDIFGTPKAKRDAVVAKAKQDAIDRREKKKKEKEEEKNKNPKKKKSLGLSYLDFLRNIQGKPTSEQIKEAKEKAKKKRFTVGRR